MIVTTIERVVFTVGVDAGSETADGARAAAVAS
jgi:hypothetical protein